jgi:hypothetical protein
MPTQAQLRRKRENRRLKRIAEAKERKYFSRKNLFGVSDPTPQEAWYKYKLWRLK